LIERKSEPLLFRLIPQQIAPRQYVSHSHRVPLAATRGRNAARVEGRSDGAQRRRARFANLGYDRQHVSGGAVRASLDRGDCLIARSFDFGLPSLTPRAFGAVALGTFAYGVERKFGLARGSVLTGGMLVGQYCAVGTMISAGTLLLGFGGTNSHYKRGLVLRTLAGFALAGFAIATIWASTAAAAPAQPALGEKLARHWCASCHIVASDQKGGSDTAPPFATIARKPGFDGGKIAQFLMDPHPKMPDMQLSRDEAKDLGAYIASLAK
jgi:mono/diheme cytochrome c family protein